MSIGINELSVSQQYLNMCEYYAHFKAGEVNDIP
jgi:hypothetical protein